MRLGHLRREFARFSFLGLGSIEILADMVGDKAVARFAAMTPVK
jgi:hypothetical protein